MTLGCALVVTPILPGQVQKSVPSPPTSISRLAIPALARGLVEDSRRLGEVSRLEMGNSPQGQQINAQVNALLRAAEQFDREIKLRDQNLPRRQQAVRDLRQAYQPVFEVLTQPGLNAPGSQRIAERIGLNINSLEDAIGIRRKPPETPLRSGFSVPWSASTRESSPRRIRSWPDLNDKVPEGPQIRIEALALRDAVRKLRRFAAQGAPDRRIVQELATAIAAQRVLQARVDRVNLGRPPGPNVLRLRRIGEVLARIQSAATSESPGSPIAASVSTRPIVSALMVGPVQGPAPALSFRSFIILQREDSPMASQERGLSHTIRIGLTDAKSSGPVRCS